MSTYRYLCCGQGAIASTGTVGEREINCSMRSLALGSLFGRHAILYVLEVMVIPVGISILPARYFELSMPVKAH